jgi:uncharacterized protein (TIGR03437 family)
MLLTPTSAGWLAVTPTSGPSGFQSNAVVNPAGLAVGTYTGSILVTSPDASNSVSVPVTLTITPVGPTASLAALANAASFTLSQGVAAPNTILSAFGTFPGCTANAVVNVDGASVPVFYSSPTLISFQIPGTVTPEAAAQIDIQCNGLTVSGTVPVGVVSPGVFTANMSGSGQAASVNQDGSIEVAAPAGSYIQVYITGGGVLGPKGEDGLSRLAATVEASIGGIPTTVYYAGEAPLNPTGLQQIDVLVPENAPKGPAALTITVNGVPAQTGVTVLVQ